MSSPLPAQELYEAMSQARFGVNRSKAIEVLCLEVVRARASEQRMAGLLVEVEMALDNRIPAVDLGGIEAALNEFYGPQNTETP